MREFSGATHHVAPNCDGQIQHASQQHNNNKPLLLHGLRHLIICLTERLMSHLSIGTDSQYQEIRISYQVVFCCAKQRRLIIFRCEDTCHRFFFIMILT
jgi:hypothetical protein